MAAVSRGGLTRRFVATVRLWKTEFAPVPQPCVIAISATGYTWSVPAVSGKDLCHFDQSESVEAQNEL